MTDQVPEIVARVLGKLPSGCSILTATHAGRSTGMLTSWLQQASFRPLLLTVAIKPGRPILDLIEESQRFVVNLLGHNPDAFFRHFGRGFAPSEPAFEGLNCHNTEYGVVLGDILGYLECQVRSTVQAGDHVLLIAQPLSGGGAADSDPHVHIRKSGLSY